jgi:hypothetical protein
MSCSDFSRVSSDNARLLVINSTVGHISKNDATTCHVALADWDYSVANTASSEVKQVKINTASVSDDRDGTTFPPTCV